MSKAGDTVPLDSIPRELKIALDNRAFEIQLFWQRSNYFLVLMSALGIGTFTIRDSFLAPVISLLATICSYLWFRTNLGSKFWQESWEVEVTDLSKEFGVRSFVKSTSDVQAQVMKSLMAGDASQKSWFRKWIDSETVKKWSVTYHMILLSFSAMVVWVAVTIVLLLRIVGVIPHAGSPEENYFHLVSALHLHIFS